MQCSHQDLAYVNPDYSECQRCDKLIDWRSPLTKDAAVALGTCRPHTARMIEAGARHTSQVAVTLSCNPGADSDTHLAYGDHENYCHCDRCLQAK